IPVAGTVPASVRFDVDSHDDRGLGVMLDWVRLEVQPGGALRLRGRARWWAPTLILAAFALFRWGGLAPLTALACVSPVAAACALAAARDPFLLAHLGSKLALPALGLTATVTALSRRRPCGAWLPPIFLAGYLLKGAGV